jgi:hypothetical protein
VAVIALGAAIFEGVRLTSGGGEVHADQKEVQADAAKQVEVIEKLNIPAAQKEEMLAHYRGLAQGASQKGPGSKPPPGAGTSGQ